MKKREKIDHKTLKVKIEKYQAEHPEASHNQMCADLKIHPYHYRKAMNKLTPSEKGHPSKEKKPTYKRIITPTYDSLPVEPSSEVTAVIIKGNAIHVANVIAAGFR